MREEKWTDEELIQVYDLQEKYTEAIVDFVRNGEESDVLKFLQLIPDLNEYYLSHEQEIYRRNEFVNEHGIEATPQGRYVYKDSSEHWKGADTLREVFEEKYQWDFAAAHPESLAVFTENMDVAFNTYSIARYDKLQNELPRKLVGKIRNLALNYPEDIQEKACRKAVYGYTNGISNRALCEYRKEHTPEFEQLEQIIQGENADTIVAAYDLQAGLMIHDHEMRDNYLTSAIREFMSDEGIFRVVYGDKCADILKQADEKAIRLASRYDFVNSDEKVAVIENHKVCLFGTAEQKLEIPYREDPFCVSGKDLMIIMDTEAEKYEREGFAKKYHPNKLGSKEYYNQSYKVVSRANSESDNQPQWKIIFKDGKIITAKADEIISGAINERLYGEQFEKFGARPLSEVVAHTGKEKLSLTEGEARISAIIRQLQTNGERVGKLKDFLEDERKNLSLANAR